MTKTRYTVSVLTKVSATVTYEPYRDRVASVENKRDASPAGTISKYAYVNDDLGRRTSVVMTGTRRRPRSLATWATLGADQHIPMTRRDDA